MARNQKSVNITAISVVGLIVLGILGAAYFMQGSSSGSTVTATGNAQLSVPADEVSVWVSVQTSNISAEAAKDANAEVTNRVLNSLYAIGLTKNDVETQNYNIYPEYDYTTNQPKITGYVATNTIIVKTKNFDIVGKIVDASVNSGALVSNINFELSTEKSNEYKTLALGNATADAKIKAEAIAGGLGKKLGSLVSITASDYNYYPYPLYARESGIGSDAVKVATEIQPRNIDVSATATVVYKVK